MEGKVLWGFPPIFTSDALLRLSCVLPSLRHCILLSCPSRQVLSAHHYSLLVFLALKLPSSLFVFDGAWNKTPRASENLDLLLDSSTCSLIPSTVRLSGAEIGMWVLLAAVLIVADRHNHFPSSIVCQQPTAQLSSQNTTKLHLSEEKKIGIKLRLITHLHFSYAKRKMTALQICCLLVLQEDCGHSSVFMS